MTPRSSRLVGVVTASLLGAVFGAAGDDPVLGVGIALVWTPAVYGFCRFPEYRSRWGGGTDPFWYAVVGAVPPVAVFVALGGPTFAGVGLSGAVFVGGLWLGGVYAGVALERGSDGTDGSGDAG